MKPHSFHCPHCQQHIEAPRDYAGKDLDCPTCKKAFIVPHGPHPVRLVLNAVEPMILVCLLIAIAGILAVKLPGRSEAAAEQEKFQARMKEINPTKFEDAWQTHDRLEDEAEAAQLRACSNWLGFNRIIDHYIDATPEAVSNWTGHATVDYVNINGGVSRTNLLFCFHEFQHHANGWVNEVEMDRLAFEARMKALGHAP